MEFDFVDHQLVAATSDGGAATLPLAPRSVATFYREVMAMLRELALPVNIWSMPVEIPSPVRFEEDTAHQSYDPVFANRFWRILAQVAARLHRRALRFRRQVQPGAFLLGQLRPGRHAIFRPARAAARGPGVHARGLLA